MRGAMVYLPEEEDSPRSWGIWLSDFFTPYRCMGDIMDAGERAGVVLDIPAFFNHSPGWRRQRAFVRLARTFERMDGRLIIRQGGEKGFMREERSLLMRGGCLFPTGELVRQAVLIPAFEWMMDQRRAELSSGAAMVLGADTPAGAEWAQVLGQHCHEMVLAGGNTVRLSRLADAIRYQTGIAAQLCQQPNERMDGSSVVVAAGAGYGDSLVRTGRQALAVLAHPGYSPRYVGGALALTGGDSGWPRGYTAPDAHPAERRMLLDAWLMRRMHGGITRRRAWQMLQHAGCALRGVEIGGHMVASIGTNGRSGGHGAAGSGLF